MYNPECNQQDRADKTRKKILKAARKLFAKNGFAGTAMAKISKLAGVNHSLMFHHFGNKEGLWTAVKLDIVEDANKQSSILPSTDLPFTIFLEKLFKQNFMFYKKHKDITRMIAWQRLEGDKSNIGLTSQSSEAKRWLAAFEHYQKTGEINPNHKPEYVMTIILAINSNAALDRNNYINDMDDYIIWCIERILVLVK